MKKTFTLALGFAFCFFLTPLAAQQWWTDVPASGLPELEGTRWIQPSAYRSIDIDLDAVKELLSQAPRWFTAEAANPLVLTFPMPDGSSRKFEVLEAPVMSPALAQKYPGMRSFVGKSPEDGTAYARFGYTHKGFHAMIRSGRHSTVYIDALSAGQNRYHQAYYRKDYAGIPGNFFACEMEEGKNGFSQEKHGDTPEMLLGDCSLRTYRLALACTGEYAAFHGGNVPDVMAEYNVAMTRVNGVYEQDMTVHMQMVDNTDLLIFLNAATDPYTNNSGGTMLGQNQTTCNNIIGIDNYDIGHVFSTGGGGVANLNAVCTNNKARGVTGQPAPVGDPFYIDYVAHEMGHQYGANHTQNNSCNRNNATAMEPGSASTIMGYAGICVPNVQNNSDDHFHAISIQEMTINVESGAGSGCPVILSLGNTGPSVTTLAQDYTLPVSTPFFLTALATDPDDDELTYCWEQMNNQIAPMPPQPTNTGGPAFRSNSPTLSPTRYFPNLGAVINGVTPTWEVIPSVSRNMNFRVSVRDNFMGGGCVKSADVALTFTNQAGPFVVLNPNTAVTWLVGTPQTITWNVANTDQAPVSCDLVDIYLSLDGGQTYPILLADNVANNGSFNIITPNNPTTQARVQVVCADNIFFDISDVNFEIVQPAEPTFLAFVSPEYLNLCIGTDPVFTINLISISDFDEPVTLSVTGLPFGATASFDQNPIPPDSQATLTISGLQAALPGEYTLEITGTAASVVQTINATIYLTAEAPTSVGLETPTDGSQGAPLNATLSWAPAFFATEYLLEISSTPAFGADVVGTATVGDTFYTTGPLQPFTLYFWRVTASNQCGGAPVSEVYAFQTGGSLCQAFTDNNPGLIIPGNQTGSWSSTLNIPEDFEISDVNIFLDIQHSWIGDLIGVLEGPGGQTVTLFDQPGVPGSQFGCGEDNMWVIFDDEAALTAAELEAACGSGGPYAIQGTYQPVNLLSVFDGGSSLGGWKITLSDIFNQDGGALTTWSVEICRQASSSNLEEINNKLLLVEHGNAATILPFFLKYERAGVAPANITYMLLELPLNGQLWADGATLSLGAIFTQAQINAGELSYQHDGSATDTDAFRFHVYDNEGGWTQNGQFNIQIVDENVISGAVQVTSGILCHGESTGIVEVSVFGGLPPYLYSIDGDDFQSGEVFTGLAAGVYDITVLDDLGNQLSLPSIELTQPDPFELQVTLTGNTLEAQASGGTSPYEYSLDGVNFQTSGLFEMLENGDYTLYAQDANGCALASLVFTVNLILGATWEAGGVSCFGGSDGFISISSVAGGESPYTYNLNGGPGQPSPLFENLPVGAYFLQIADNQGNILTLSGIAVSEPDELLVNVTLMPGAIDIGATGGTPPYQYSLDGGDTFEAESSYTGLPSGDYLVVVEDANGCRSEIETVSVISSVTDIRAEWKLQLLPNPNTGAFVLEGIDDATRQLNWQVVDLPGRVLHSGSFATTPGRWSQTFELPLPAGAYWVRLVSAEKGSAALPLVVIE